MAHTFTKTSGKTHASLLGTPPGELALRVCGGKLDGRVVRLSSPKCTIGSGRRCTLKLRQKDGWPLNCLILRGAIGSVVRRWSPDTRLNGRAFTDAPLCQGDRLSCGSVEFEVLGNISTRNGLSQHQEAVRHLRCRARRMIDGLRVARKHYAELEAEFEKQKADWIRQQNRGRRTYPTFGVVSRLSGKRES